MVAGWDGLCRKLGKVCRGNKACKPLKKDVGKLDKTGKALLNKGNSNKCKRV